MFCFGRSMQIFFAFVQVHLTILDLKHVGKSVVPVKLKLKTESVKVTHSDNMMYASILNSPRGNCYLWKLKCAKFTFCIIILKFRICVCVCRGG